MKLISFDIETWGLQEGYTLQPWRIKTNEAGILCQCFCTKEEMIAATCKNPDVTVNLFGEYLKEKSNILLCGWNLKFDLAWYCAQVIQSLLYEFKYLDGMLLLKRIMQD